jgi:hypothetical protein
VGEDDAIAFLDPRIDSPRALVGGRVLGVSLSGAFQMGLTLRAVERTEPGLAGRVLDHRRRATKAVVPRSR